MNATRSCAPGNFGCNPAVLRVLSVCLGFRIAILFLLPNLARETVTEIQK